MNILSGSLLSRPKVLTYTHMCKHKVLLVIQVINSTSARREPTNEYTSQSNQGKLLTPITRGVSPTPHATRRTTISTEWIKVRVDLQRFFVVCVCWFLSPFMRSPLFGHKLRFMFANGKEQPIFGSGGKSAIFQAFRDKPPFSPV